MVERERRRGWWRVRARVWFCFRKRGVDCWNHRGGRRTRVTRDNWPERLSREFGNVGGDVGVFRRDGILSRGGELSDAVRARWERFEEWGEFVFGDAFDAWAKRRGRLLAGLCFYARMFNHRVLFERGGDFVKR